MAFESKLIKIDSLPPSLNLVSCHVSCFYFVIFSVSNDFFILRVLLFTYMKKHYISFFEGFSVVE